MTRAAIYCRISDDRDGGGLGVKRQEDDCRALADRRGWAVVRVFVDNDVSAYRGRVRAAYREMLDVINAGDVDAVVVWHLDRLHRHPKELEEFFEVCDAADIKDLASVTGDVDLSTFDGRFMARILGAVARKESDDKSRRTRRKHLELAEAGAAVGGGRPFGYEVDRVTVRTREAALIVEAVDRILAGDSIRSIATDWNRLVGIPAVQGGPWRPVAVRRVLLSHRIAGLRSHGREGPVVAKGVWPAIVDPETHARVRAVLLDPARHANGGFGARKYLLTGFLVCGNCGTRLIAQPRSDRRRSYTCSSGPGRGGCGGMRVVAEPLEELVVEAVMQRLDRPEVAAIIRSDQGADEEERAAGEAVARAEAKLEELARDWATDSITKVEWMAARHTVEARLAASRRELGRHRRSSVLDGFIGRPGELRAAWADLTLARRRAVISSAIDHVTIGPAIRGINRFDAGRVDVVWRI